MPIRQFKPVTKGSRFRSVVGFRRDHAHDAGEVAARAAQEERRARQPRPHLDASHRRWPQAEVPDHRLQAQPARPCRHGARRSSTIRIARRASRSCSTRTARSATSCTRRGSSVGDTIVVGPGLRRAARQRAAAAARSRSARRCTTSSSRSARAGRSAARRACRRRSWRRKASTSPLRMPSHRDAAACTAALPRDDRRGRQRRARARVVGQGGQDAAGRAAARRCAARS